jgi:3-hydroxyisobutyrate dehydrogenase-like beta-hydroxyacid dehydrogenase
MTNITVVGCGRMGSALSRALLNAGQDIMVYDVVKASTLPLVELGASAAETPSDAIKNCDVLVFSINSYENTFKFLETSDVLDNFKGKTIVQFTTGSKDEVTELDNMLKKHNIHYLEGKIMCYPEEIGKEESLIVYSGNESVFQNTKSTLEALSGMQTFVSPNITGASTIDLSLLTTYYGILWGVLQGAAISREQNVSVASFAEAAKIHTFSALEDMVQNGLKDVQSGDYKSDSVSNSVHAHALRLCVEIIKDSEMDTGVTDSILTLLEKAKANGYADMNIESIVEVMKK